MSRVAEGVGKTYDEAVKNALDIIGLKKSQVMIEIIKEPKKTFFSILEHSQVKVKVTELDEVTGGGAYNFDEKSSFKAPKVVVSEDDVNDAKSRIDAFLKEYFVKLGIDLSVGMVFEDNVLKVDISGEKAGLVIGYRGENLEALQVLVSNIANKGKERHVKVLLDAEGYRKKRAKTLEDLALKVSSTVVSKRRSITLEPMSAFERKVIHSTLQNHPKVKTHSVGEEPFRKVIVSLK